MHNHPMMVVMDAGALIALLGTFWGDLPHWVALLAFIVYAMQIWKMLRGK